MAEHINLSGHFNDGITPKLRVLKSALANINKLHRELRDLYKQITKRINEFKDVISVLTKRLQLQDKTLKKTVNSLRSYRNELSGIDNTAMRASRSINRVTDSVQMLRRNVRGSGRELRSLKRNLTGFGGIQSMWRDRRSVLSQYQKKIGVWPDRSRMALLWGSSQQQYAASPSIPKPPTSPLVAKPPRQPKIKPKPKGDGPGGKGPWSRNWSNAGSAFGHTMGHVAGHIMHSILSLTFRAGANLLTTALRGAWWAIMDGVQDEMSDIQSAGGMFAVDKRQSGNKRLFDNFTQARLFQEETNRLLARSAATLPGTTNEYVKASKRLTDSIMLAAVNNPNEFRQLAQDRGAGLRDNDRAQMREDISTLLAKFTEQSVLLGLGSSGRGTLSMDMILEQLLTREQISMGRMIRYAPMRDNPVLTSILTDNKDAINATKARSAQRLQIVMEVLEKALPREVINAMRSSLEGVSEAYRSFLVDQDIGLFGLRRELKFMVVSTNSYGQFIDEQGKVVKSLSEAAKINTTVFRLLRDTIAGFGIPLMELIPLISELWDPMRKLADQLVGMRERAILFQQRFTAYTNWYEGQGFSKSGTRGALAAVNKYIRHQVGDSYEYQYNSNIDTLGSHVLKNETAANMFLKMMKAWMKSDAAYEWGNLISSFIGEVFIALGELVYFITNGIGGTDNKFVRGLIEGWENLKSDIFTGAESAASQAIKEIIHFFKNLILTMVKVLITEFPAETFWLTFIILLIPAIIAGLGSIFAMVGLEFLKWMKVALLTKIATGLGMTYAGAAGAGAGAVGGGAVLKASFVALGAALTPVIVALGIVVGSIMAIILILRQWKNMLKVITGIIGGLGIFIGGFVATLLSVMDGMVYAIAKIFSIIPGIGGFFDGVAESSLERMKKHWTDLDALHRSNFAMLSEGWRDGNQRSRADLIMTNLARGGKFVGTTETRRLTNTELEIREAKIGLASGKEGFTQTMVDNLLLQHERELGELGNLYDKKNKIASQLKTASGTDEIKLGKQLQIANADFQSKIHAMFYTEQSDGTLTLNEERQGYGPSAMSYGPTQYNNQTVLENQRTTVPKPHEGAIPDFAGINTSNIEADSQTNRLVEAFNSGKLKVLLENPNIEFSKDSAKALGQIMKQVAEGVSLSPGQIEELLDFIQKNHKEKTDEELKIFKKAIEDFTDNDNKLTDANLKVFEEMLKIFPLMTDLNIKHFKGKNDKTTQAQQGDGKTTVESGESQQVSSIGDGLWGRLGNFAGSLFSQPAYASVVPDDMVIASQQIPNPHIATAHAIQALENTTKAITNEIKIPETHQNTNKGLQNDSIDTVNSLTPANSAVYYTNANGKNQTPVVLTVYNSPENTNAQNQTEKPPIQMTNNFTVSGAQDPEKVAEEVSKLLYQKMQEMTYANIG